MKKGIVLILLVTFLVACAENSNKEETNDVADVGNEVVENPQQFYDENITNFSLTTEQEEHILKMIDESGIYDDYATDYNGFGANIYKNTIEILAQAKDFPTFLMVRYIDNRFVGYPFSYTVRRFYRESIEFTYVKDNMNRKAVLEMSWYVNQDNNSRLYWYEEMPECHLYVPNASNQTNYSFVYDYINHEIYVLDDKGNKEEIKFAKDLQEKLLEYCDEQIKKYFAIDQAAMSLADEIVQYIESVE